MNRLVLLLAVLLVFFSCSSNDAVIKGTISNGNNRDIVLAKLDINTMLICDTIKTDKNGSFKFTIKYDKNDNNPQFYYLTSNDIRLASFIVKPSDNITFYSDTLGENVNIIGSPESSTLRLLDSAYYVALAQYRNLTSKISEIIDNEEFATELKEYKQELGRLYVKHKQNVLKSIFRNPYSFSNIPALYQKFEDNLPLFADFNDGLVYKRVYDSLKTQYPNSPYVKFLKKISENFENQVAMQQMIENAGEQPFPNIVLPDINSQSRELYELKGRPFMLFFWGAADVNQKVFNRELLELYSKYSQTGFEIYQVSVDTDKTLWATSVKEQNLPWINVCDGKGKASIALRTYNIDTVPSLFIFDSDGNIVAKDEYDIQKLDKILKTICR